MVICLERGADLHMAQLMPLPLIVSCFSKIQIEYIERVCLCVPFYYTIVTAHVICDDRLVDDAYCPCVFHSGECSCNAFRFFAMLIYSCPLWSSSFTDVDMLTVSANM